MMEISIVIPNLNSPIIDEVVLCILGQDNKYPIEIIVVGLDRYRLIPNDPRVVSISTKNPISPAKARNLGVKKSKGDLLIFLDADCLAQPGFISAHVQLQQRFPNSIIGGSVLFPQDNYISLCDNVATFHEYMSNLPEGERRVLPTLNLSLQRKIWERLGGFDPRYRFTGEDTDFAIRAKECGMNVLFSPIPMIVHKHNRLGLLSLLRHAYRFGQNTPFFNRFDRGSYLFFRILIFSIGAPLVGLIVVLKILLISCLPIYYWYTLPIVYLAKMAWSLGVAFRHSQRHSE